MSEGFGESAIRGVVREQILHPRTSRQLDAGRPGQGRRGPRRRRLRRASVAKPGKDEGLLATAVKPAGSGKPAVAEGGTLTIPADPNGQLAYVNATATAPAGQLKIVMPNESGAPHNIAIDGKGEGEVVEKGDSEFSATFKPGVYTYYCAVAGHRAAGMEGKLTVK